jgi:hypothetical protein
MSFILCASGCIVGPVIEYSDFKHWCELTGPYQTMPRGLKGYTTILPALS